LQALTSAILNLRIKLEVLTSLHSESQASMPNRQGLHVPHASSKLEFCMPLYSESYGLLPESTLCSVMTSNWLHQLSGSFHSQTKNRHMSDSNLLLFTGVDLPRIQQGNTTKIEH